MCGWVDVWVGRCVGGKVGRSVCGQVGRWVSGQECMRTGG